MIFPRGRCILTSRSKGEDWGVEDWNPIDIITFISTIQDPFKMCLFSGLCLADLQPVSMFLWVHRTVPRWVIWPGFDFKTKFYNKLDQWFQTQIPTRAAKYIKIICGPHIEGKKGFEGHWTMFKSHTSN